MNSVTRLRIRSQCFGFQQILSCKHNITFFQGTNSKMGKFASVKTKINLQKSNIIVKKETFVKSYTKCISTDDKLYF
jgi:hypothetical protein